MGGNKNVNAMVTLPPFKNVNMLSLLLVVWLQQTQELIISWELIDQFSTQEERKPLSLCKEK